MAGNNLTVQTTLPSIGKLQSSMANEQNLLNKASQLVPNTETFLKSILEKDIHSADAERAANEMTYIASDYLDNYRKNPFYAFTQRGRKQTTQMQQIVNNPLFKQLEFAKKANDAEFERVQEKGLLQELVVDDYGRLATRDAEGNRVFRYAGDINPENEYVVNVLEDHTLLDRVDGGRRIASYDVQALEDTEQQIRDTIKGLGTAKWKSETDAIRTSFAGTKTDPYAVTNVRETEDNNAQIRAEIDRLRDGGLSRTALKSLYSAYYRAHPNEIGTADAEKRADEWVFNQISAVAEGQRISKDFRTTKAGLAGSSSGASLATAPLQTLAAWRTGVLGGTSVDHSFVGNYAQTAKVSNLPANVAFDGATMTKDENGNPVRMTRTTDDFLPMQLADNSAVHVISLQDNDELKIKAGDAVRVGSDFLRNTAVWVGNPNSVAQMADIYVDNAGNVVPAKKADEITRKLQAGLIQPGTAEYARYVTTYTDENGQRRTGVQLKPAMMFEIMVPKEEGLFKGLDSSAAKKVEDLGYSSSEEIAKELNVRAGLQLDNGGWLTNDDQGYRVKVVVPMNVTNDAAGSFVFDDSRSLVQKQDVVTTNQQQQPFVREIATEQNAVKTGNTGAQQGYPSINVLSQ